MKNYFFIHNVVNNYLNASISFSIDIYYSIQNFRFKQYKLLFLIFIFYIDIIYKINFIVKLFN